MITNGTVVSDALKYVTAKAEKFVSANWRKNENENEEEGWEEEEEATSNRVFDSDSMTFKELKILKK